MSGPLDELEALLDRIDSLEERERFADALGVARRACALAPDDAEVWDARGEMALRSGEITEAADAWERLTELEPGSGLAWFQLGEARLWQGRLPEADACFARAAHLDHRHHVIPHRVPAAEFEAIAGSVLRGLPEQVVAFLESSGTGVVIRPLPGLAMVVDLHLDPHALGYWMGNIYGVTGGWGATTPAEIEIYQLNIENWCGDEARLREEIRKTVLHEVGHAVGMDHADLDADGY